MKKYIQVLQEHCKQNPPDHGDYQSVMNLLYWTYTHYNPVDEQKLRDGFAKLRAQLPHLSLQEFDPVFDTVSDLCIDHERFAFYEGLRLGVTLVEKLQQSRL